MVNNSGYAVSEDAGNRHKEIDLYATLPVGPLSFTVTDYNSPDGGDSFDFSDDGSNVVELSVGYTKDNLSLLAAINVAGLDTDNAKYCEAGYKFYDKDGYTAKGVVGLGDEDDIALVNTGISVSKDRFTASYIYNPDTAKSNLVFMASF